MKAFQLLLINFFFKQLILNLLFGLVCFGLDRWIRKTDKINSFWFALIEFGLVCLIEFGRVWFANSTDK